jgi:hypothetical protein
LLILCACGKDNNLHKLTSVELVAINEDLLGEVTETSQVEKKNTFIEYIVKAKEQKKLKENIPYSYIQSIKVNSDDRLPGSNFIKPVFQSRKNYFPIDWVKEQDIEALISILGSTEKCNPYCDIFVSSLNLEDAEVGGYAALFIELYMYKKPIKFYGYVCPKVNEIRYDRILKWWEEQKKINNKL